MKFAGANRLRLSPDADRMRALAREAYNATHRVYAAYRRGEPSPAWLRARLDEAIGALGRARNRAVLMDAEGD